MTLLIMIPAAVVAVVAAALLYVRSPYVTQVDRAPAQPVPFSHQHHVGALGIDCRYCHSAVENSPVAGLPATEVCMSCHSQLWTNAEMLQPVRESLSLNKPLAWARVHDLPDFVYFDHSVHVNHGVACESCHGRVDRMPLTVRKETLHMRWCLDCHRHPQQNLRPPTQVFVMGWQPPSDRATSELAKQAYRTPSSRQLTDCYTCHR